MPSSMLDPWPGASGPDPVAPAPVAPARAARGRAVPLVARVPPDLPPAQGWPSRGALGPLPESVQPSLFTAALGPARRLTATQTQHAGQEHAGQEHALGEESGQRIRTVRLVVAAAAGLPELAPFATRIGVGMAEVLLGRRAAAHLEPYASAAVLQRLDDAAEARLTGSRARATRVRVASLRVQLTTPYSAEACLHVTAGRRLVLAYRLLGRARRWVCTDLDLLTPGPSPITGGTAAAARSR